jgi:hypothetical protein
MLALTFVAIVLLVAWSLLRGVAAPPFLRLLRRTMTQSSQLPVRVAMLLLGALVVTAEDLGLDLALGALAAGMIVKLAVQHAPNDLLQQKLDAVGFGFLVPVFFIANGMKLDVAAVFASGPGLLRTAALFGALIVVHLPLMLMTRRIGTGRESVALGLYAATTLSLIWVGTGRPAYLNNAPRRGDRRSDWFAPINAFADPRPLLLPQRRRVDRQAEQCDRPRKGALQRGTFRPSNAYIARLAVKVSEHVAAGVRLTGRHSLVAFSLHRGRTTWYGQAFIHPKEDPSWQPRGRPRAGKLGQRSLPVASPRPKSSASRARRRRRSGRRRMTLGSRSAARRAS